jgi:hypothetical protein
VDDPRRLDALGLRREAGGGDLGGEGEGLPAVPSFENSFTNSYSGENSMVTE